MDGYELLRVRATDGDRPDSNGFADIRYSMTDDRFDVDPITVSTYIYSPALKKGGYIGFGLSVIVHCSYVCHNFVSAQYLENSYRISPNLMYAFLEHSAILLTCIKR